MVKRISAFLGVLFFASMATTGYSAETLRQGLYDFHYRIFAGGIELAELKSHYVIADSRYSLKSEMSGVGFLQSLFGVEGTFTGSGVIAAHDIVPEQFTSKADWRGKKTQSSVTFASGKVQSFDYSPEKSIFKPEKYPEGVLEDVVDPASVALILAGHLAHSGKCTLDVRVFTGRHRVDIAVVDDGIQPLPENDMVGQHDNVRLCTATADKIRPKDKPKDEKPKDEKPIVVKMYMVFDPSSSLPYPILLESTYKKINTKAWMVKNHYAPS